MPVIDAPTRRPAAAYLRPPSGAGLEAVRQALTELLAFTEQRGFVLAAVHCEERPSERLATWAALITNCRSEGIAHVVVPSPDHFHHDALVAAYMREELAEKIRGTVWYADAASTPRVTAGRHEH